MVLQGRCALRWSPLRQGDPPVASSAAIRSFEGPLFDSLLFLLPATGRGNPHGLRPFATVFSGRSERLNRRVAALLEISIAAAAGELTSGDIFMIHYSGHGGWVNGLFTGTLLRVWADGAFSGDYRAFHHAILIEMPPTQSPNYYVTGIPDPDFQAESPFTIAAAP